MTKKTYFGKNIDRYIEFSEEEKKFIREFKLLLLDGLKVKKYCKTFGFVFRNLSITPIYKKMGHSKLNNITKFTI